MYIFLAEKERCSKMMSIYVYKQIIKYQYADEHGNSRQNISGTEIYA